MIAPTPLALRRRATVTTLGLALLLGHCGGIKSAGTLPGDAGLCEGTASSGETPPEHRPTPVTCPRTPIELPVTDAGPATCNASTDCQAYEYCTDHVCGSDMCLVDADCPTGNVCVCSNDAGGGDRVQANVCVPAHCTVDSDCGPGNVCEPSRGYCGGVTGYDCSSSKDTCVDPSKDCSCGGNSCVYAPMVGYFVCADSVCNG
jgi:hypothetical protein